jgi:hypothetical protein
MGVATVPCERDDSSLNPFSKAPSYFASSTTEMQKRGAEVLRHATREMEPRLGPYSAEGIVAEIFHEMLKVREAGA